MKFHLQRPTANVVTAMGPGWVRVGDTEYRENIVVLPDAVMPGWAPNGFTALGEPDFASLLSYKPEMVLLGTGASLRFPHPSLTRALTDAGVGLEVMDTPAACRTFNILAAEGRSVVAVLLIN